MATRSGVARVAATAAASFDGLRGQWSRVPDGGLDGNAEARPSGDLISTARSATPPITAM